MSRRKVPPEAKGSGSEPTVPLKIRIMGKPTTIHVPLSLKQDYWPAFQEISKIHFKKTASQMIADFVIGVVLQHMKNPQSSLNGFFERPDIPALPTIGRGAKIDWSKHESPTLVKVLDDTQHILDQVSKELKIREGPRKKMLKDDLNFTKMVEASIKSGLKIPEKTMKRYKAIMEKRNKTTGSRHYKGRWLDV